MFWGCSGSSFLGSFLLLFHVLTSGSSLGNQTKLKPKDNLGDAHLLLDKELVWSLSLQYFNRRAPKGG